MLGWNGCVKAVHDTLVCLIKQGYVIFHETLLQYCESEQL